MRNTHWSARKIPHVWSVMTGGDVPVTSFADAVVHKSNGTMQARNAYRPAELAAVILQGKDQPRPLTHDETELARKNRRAARADLAAMEEWYRAELKETDPKAPAIRRYPTGTSHYGWAPRRGPDPVPVWKPVVW